MHAQAIILILFAVLLILSIAGVLPIIWTSVCIAYLATAKAIEVITSARG